MMHIQKPVYHPKFRQIQVYSRPIKTYSAIFRTLCISCIFRTLLYSYLKPRIYSELCQDILFHSYNAVYQSHIENSAIYRTLPYLEFWHTQDPSHIQNPVQISSFRHIQAYSIKIFITLTFFLVTVILHTFHRNLKRHMSIDYNEVNFNARPSLFT